jgi:hypothetical protein
MPQPSAQGEAQLARAELAGVSGSRTRGPGTAEAADETKTRSDRHGAQWTVWCSLALGGADRLFITYIVNVFTGERSGEAEGEHQIENNQKEDARKRRGCRIPRLCDVI